METQLKKGVLDLCVMAVLFGKDHYGYQIVSTISKTIKVSEGTIYPLLRRLKNEGLVNTYLEESQEGPPRKYYTLTSEGKKAYREQKKIWTDFTKGVTQLLGERR